MFRACAYSFISQEKHGYFAHFPGDTGGSFHFALNMITEGIEAMEHEG